MRHFAIGLVVLALTACAANARKLTQLRVGMAKEDVLQVLGRPASTGANAQAELWYYRLNEGQYPNDSIRTFYVRFVDGKVDVFDRLNEPEPIVVPSPSPSMPLPLPPPPPSL